MLNPLLPWFDFYLGAKLHIVSILNLVQRYLFGRKIPIFVEQFEKIMDMKKNIVSSFDVDHRTLGAGLYLRSVYNINEELAVRSWDLRFRAPMAHAPLGSGEVHTIEHLMAYYLRLDEKIGSSIVSFCPMGCKTGFYLSTMQNVESEDVRQALGKVYKQVFPLKSTEDIVGLNEIQCGNPGLYAIDSTNAAMAEYMRVLFSAEEAAELGIGNVYEKQW